jgi:flagellar basal body L-ring protein FlgH
MVVLQLNGYTPEAASMNTCASEREKRKEGGRKRRCQRQNKCSNQLTRKIQEVLNFGRLMVDVGLRVGSLNSET